jgi:hypothetical protein
MNISHIMVSTAVLLALSPSYSPLFHSISVGTGARHPFCSELGFESESLQPSCEWWWCDLRQLAFLGCDQGSREGWSIYSMRIMWMDVQRSTGERQRLSLPGSPKIHYSWLQTIFRWAKWQGKPVTMVCMRHKGTRHFSALTRSSIHGCPPSLLPQAIGCFLW